MVSKTNGVTYPSTFWPTSSRSNQDVSFLKKNVQGLTRSKHKRACEKILAVLRQASRSSQGGKACAQCRPF
eukprot:12886146-Prorocentrum_lima.AAC.1